MGIQALCGVCWKQVPVVAFKQLCFIFLFQIRNGPGYGRLRQVQIFRCFGNTAVPVDFDEALTF